MLWDEAQVGVFETHVLLVVIRFDNRTLSLDKCLIASVSCLMSRRLFLTGFMQWMGIIPWNVWMARDMPINVSSPATISSPHPQSTSLKTMSQLVLEQKTNHRVPFHMVTRMNGVQITGRRPILLAKAQLVCLSKLVASFLHVDIQLLKL